MRKYFLLGLTIFILGYCLKLAIFSYQRESYVRTMEPLIVVDGTVLQKESHTPILLRGVLIDYFRSHNHTHASPIASIKGQIAQIKLLLPYGVNCIGIYLSGYTGLMNDLPELDELISFAAENNIYVYLMPVAYEFDANVRNSSISEDGFEDLARLVERLTVRYQMYPNVLMGFGAEPSEQRETFDSWNDKQILLAKKVRTLNPEVVLLITSFYTRLERYLAEPFPYKNVIYAGGGYVSANDQGAIDHPEYVKNQIVNVAGQMDDPRVATMLIEFGGHYGADFSSAIDLDSIQKMLQITVAKKRHFTMYKLSATYATDGLAILDQQWKLTKRGEVFVDALTALQN